MKYFLFIFSIVVFTSCDLFKIQEKEKNTSEVLAIVNTEKLFRIDVTSVLPKNINRADSLVLANSYIQNWAIKRLLLAKAKNNSSLETVNQIEGLVQDYKESLLINNYKDQLVKQKLDTVVSDQEIEEYYLLNKENFKLNEELVKIRYLHIDNNLIDEGEILSLFKSNDINDLEETAFFKGQTVKKIKIHSKTRFNRFIFGNHKRCFTT
jgi:hypothetical protein